MDFLTRLCLPEAIRHFNDSSSLAEKANQADVDVILNIGDGVYHCFPLEVT